MIDWTNPEDNVSTNFTVKDCIFLPQWNRMATEEDGLIEEVKDNLINLCARMEMVRVFLGNEPIYIHCGFRPESYNKQVQGAPFSAHLKGKAFDWNLKGFGNATGCNTIRLRLIPKLEEFDLRMENNEHGAWIHLDTREPLPGHPRFFIPQSIIIQ